MQFIMRSVDLLGQLLLGLELWLFKVIRPVA